MSITYKNILVAYDGSEQSQLAFEQAKMLATLNDSEITVLQVVPSVNYFLYLPDTYIYSDLAARQKEMMSYAQDQMNANFVYNDTDKINVIVQEGSPKRTIVEYAEKKKFDLIVMGATGVHGINKLVVGSTTSFVVNQAPCQVLVVK